MFQMQKEVQSIMDSFSKQLTILCIVTATILGVGIYIWFGLDSSMDFNILHNQIMTNQTFVDSLDCEKIIIIKNSLDLALSPTQQDEINQLKIDFKRLAEEKECLK